MIKYNSRKSNFLYLFKIEYNSNKNIIQIWQFIKMIHLKNLISNLCHNQTIHLQRIIKLDNNHQIQVLEEWKKIQFNLIIPIICQLKWMNSNHFLKKKRKTKNLECLLKHMKFQLLFIQNPFRKGIKISNKKIKNSKIYISYHLHLLKIKIIKKCIKKEIII